MVYNVVCGVLRVERHKANWDATPLFVAVFFEADQIIKTPYLVSSVSAYTKRPKPDVIWNSEVSTAMMRRRRLLTGTPNSCAVIIKSLSIHHKHLITAHHRIAIIVMG